MIEAVSIFFFLLMYDLGNSFMGVYLYLLMFVWFLFGMDLFGVEFMKADLYGMFGLDNISYLMVLLLMWIVSLVLILFYNWFLSLFIVVLLASIFLMFSSVDLLYLFICFEVSMLPIFFIIMFFGYYKERYKAVLYMFIYTMVSSLVFLMVLLIAMDWWGVLGVDFMFNSVLAVDGWLISLIMMMFLVKVPIFTMHIWLPKAHVEAPVYGSMILASIMLKMGGYGVIRCLEFFVFDVWVNDFFFCLCLAGSLMLNYMCLYQVDLKVLVAYSSVSHMCVMLMGFFSGTDVGFKGGVVMMLSHGICSSGMFYVVDSIYKFSRSRLVVLSGGIMGCLPVTGWLWLSMLVSNLGVPPFFGILGELMLVSSCLMFGFAFFLWFLVMFFFLSCFVMNMYGSLVGGYCCLSWMDVDVIFCYGVVMHLIPLVGFTFFLNNCL